MAQKNRLKKDHTARISRMELRKAKRVAANRDRHLDNLRKLGESALPVGHGKDRPSTVIRKGTRAANGKHEGWLAAAAASGATPPDLYSTAEHLHIVAERAKAHKIAAAMGAE